MSDNLVKRLRDCANGIGDFKNDLGDFGLCDTAADRIEELEAKLAKAVEALTQLVIEYDEVDLAYDEPKSMTAAYNVASGTLAELKGETDD